MIGKILKGIAAPAAGAFAAREERKAEEARLRSKLDLTESEWELLKIKESQGSLKDEIVTYWMLALMTAILLVPEDWGIVNVDRFASIIGDPAQPLAHLFYIVIGSAVGIRWKSAK